MRPAPTVLVRALAVVALLAAAFVAAPRAASAPAARAVLSTVPADVPEALLGEPLATRVTVRARVTPAGLVDSTAAVDGDPRLHAPAEAAVRWWVFAPARAAAWTTVSVPFTATADDEPLRPDVIALARQAEANGDYATAIAAWVGALARLGRSPVANNEWTIREHTWSLARRLPAPPPVGDDLQARGRGARSQQLRTVTHVDHEALVERLDHVLAGAPWWDEAYLWRAGALAGAGRATDALRSLRAYREATTDSAGAVFAARMIDRLAAADTLGVTAAIRTWRVTVGPEDR